MKGWIMQTCIIKKCGISWYHPSGFDGQRRNDHQSFYCPNGHGQYYTELNQKEKLQKRLDQEIKDKNYYIEQKEVCCKRLQKTKHQLNGLRGYLTKLKRGKK
jgi:hypothetical protein